MLIAQLCNRLIYTKNNFPTKQLDVAPSLVFYYFILGYPVGFSATFYLFIAVIEYLLVIVSESIKTQHHYHVT